MKERERRSAHAQAIKHASGSVFAADDAALLARIAEGELSALGVLYDRHYLSVLHFSQRVMRGVDGAEDVSQETFLTASRMAYTFDGRASCRPWLLGIASRLVLARSRRAARLARFVARLTDHAPDTSAASPQEHASRSEQQDQLIRALATLSADKRLVVVLTEVEGLSCAEVAQALDIPVGTVWTRLHHARRALRKQIERYLP